VVSVLKTQLKCEKVSIPTEENLTSKLCKGFAAMDIDLLVLIDEERIPSLMSLSPKVA